VCGDAGTLVSDPELLRQLLGNLLSNAIRYNREDGTVRLRIDGDEDLLSLIVEDTGLGIPPEHQQRIFERFYRIDAHRSRQTGGTGLGLAIVKQLLGVLGGHISLESAASGTRFDIQLPRHALQASVGPQGAPAPAPAATTSRPAVAAVGSNGAVPASAPGAPDAGAPAS
jgi:two-component system sensor histidine kinase SenX3